MKRRLITAVLAVAAVVWAGTVAAAYRAIQKFESTPGRAANARATWPSDSKLVRNDGAPTLVMTVHPHCSCSRASIEELQAVIEKSPRTLRTYVVVFRPRQMKSGWEETEVVKEARKLRGARVVMDDDGREAKRFGAFTSGQTYVYDTAGNLRFEGGITLLRGHAGLNSGRADIIRIVNANAGHSTHPVFGCSIVNRGERP
ncbi:MAG TPA: RedB protein [Thermoanaerobaculia bacterium]|nr:RedB protein [Thermoanaerobaculia bacterium]